MGDRTRGWIETLWPIFGGLVLVVSAFVSLQGRVNAAEGKADAALSAATEATKSTQGVREALIDLRRIVEERIPARPR